MIFPIRTHHFDNTTKLIFLISAMTVLSSCEDSSVQEPALAEDIFAKQGDPRPGLSEQELEIFRAGEQVASRRFSLDDGLGPDFNVTFCGSCHEKPTFGGAAGHYRDFYIYGEQLVGGGFVPSGPRSGVLNTFGDLPQDDEESPHVPLTKILPENTADHFTRRNPIPFFGIGLLAEISEEDILSRADPDDLDGDGISGRPNYDQGYVGRFGLKAQTVSIENFIRGPLFNHIGITSNPLSSDKQAMLPVPSVAMDRLEEDQTALFAQKYAIYSEQGPLLETQVFHQAAAPSESLTDHDHVPDPELSEDDLFALVSWAMLLAAPIPDPLDAESEYGQGLFYAMKCDLCHAPRLTGPRGEIPAYTDLLLHDMGEDLADGVVMALASGSEFRTQPLWGVSSTGPYLYDGRAGSLDEAIALHGGEASQSRDLYLAADVNDQVALISFLESLGGRSQKSVGLIPPQAEIGNSELLGMLVTRLSDADLQRFKRGQALYDTDFSIGKGLGPLFNGDSCRGCHFDPIVGGSGPTGVSAVRLIDGEADILEHDGDLIQRYNIHGAPPNVTFAEGDENKKSFELRQALPTFGLGILEEIPVEAIILNEDPDDEDADGVKGIARRLSNGDIGRFGWRSQVVDIRTFVADALGAELGMTIPHSLNLTYGLNEDTDQVSDPEISESDFNDLSYFISQLAPPVTIVSDDVLPMYERGETLFNEIGCAQCHIPKLTDSQSMAAYTNLLLHMVQPQNTVRRLFRTPPLWAIAKTGSYWHDGRASTITQAIELHSGEAELSIERWLELSVDDREKLLTFVEHL